MPKISVITPTYNSSKTISRTIDSVISQTHKDIEYIIIDDNSSDGTRDIVSAFKDKIVINFISEKDDGIYDAMNKGVKIATGDIIGILNSDDFYASPDVLGLVMKKFEDESVDAVYGDISYFSGDTNNVTRHWRAGEYKESKLSNGWAVPHPSLFLRKSVYDKYGLFNTDLKIAADYEFILRILKVHKIKVKYVPKVFVRMYNGGNSGSSFRQRAKGWKELKKSWKLNNLKIPPFFVLRRVFFKLTQFF